MSGITIYGLLDYLHILLLVFWLGTDLGVLLAARRVRDAALSPAERLTLLDLALRIDLLPRIAFSLMFAVGATLGYLGGTLPLPGWALGLLWALTAAWLTLTLALLAAEGKPVQGLLAAVQRVWLVAVALACGLAALWLLAGSGEAAVPGWLALKIGLYGFVCLAAIGIDRAFLPLIPAMGELARSGSSAALETRISGAINHALRYVHTLYGLLFLAAFLGVTKPMLAAAV
ncbi:hypothetical protein [Lentisalinibacter orientalis]|uniref:hypothetical protein n=1 Tax=Lentisalinibacter orientalis TaxID=2992241 RepID=UPI0038632F78